MTAPITTKLNINIRDKKLTNISRNHNSDNNVAQKPQFESLKDIKCASTETKIGVFVTTLAGVGAALALIMKKQNLPVDFVSMFKKPFKESSLAKVSYKEVEILTLAASSVAGGLLGGAIFDKKENLRAKFRESVIQMVGNIMVPLSFVAAGSRIFKKYEKPIENFIKAETIQNKFLKEVAKHGPGLAVTGVGLMSGIFVGNKVGNWINEKLFKINDNRKVKATDCSAHLDDIGLAASLAAGKNIEENIIGHTISRFIPAAMMVAGLSVGLEQEKDVNSGNKCQG